jgi:hypothetical protein
MPDSALNRRVIGLEDYQKTLAVKKERDPSNAKQQRGEPLYY